MTFVVWTTVAILLLALLGGQVGGPGSELLLAIVGVVVLASVGLHGASAATVADAAARRSTRIASWRRLRSGPSGRWRRS